MNIFLIRVNRYVITAMMVWAVLGCRSYATEPTNAIPPVATVSQASEVDAQTRCQNLAQSEKDHTYIYVVNGLDPLFLGKLNGFCKSIRCVGYKNVELVSMRRCGRIEDKICCIRQNDPRAKIVIAGYSWGANRARAICNSLNNRSVPVDLLVYIGGDMVGDREYSRPPNAARILNLNGHGLVLLGRDMFFNGEDISGATNYRLDVPHLGLPRRQETLDLFLAAVADTTEKAPAVAENNSLMAQTP